MAGSMASLGDDGFTGSVGSSDFTSSIYLFHPFSLGPLCEDNRHAPVFEAHEVATSIPKLNGKACEPSGGDLNDIRRVS